VTMDEIDDLDVVRITTTINGEVLQDSTLAHLVFDFPTIIRYITAFRPLSAGDVIVTGTPGGVGVVADPPRLLVPGDVAEIEVTGVGLLRNEIVDPEVSR
jgi:2-keto-4-pentenoate hydratase/2-oxohepta-3-ene-1,7-dioic acid hydratase in catechol pathway